MLNTIAKHLYSAIEDVGASKQNASALNRTLLSRYLDTKEAANLTDSFRAYGIDKVDYLQAPELRGIYFQLGSTFGDSTNAIVAYVSNPFIGSGDVFIQRQDHLLLVSYDHYLETLDSISGLTHDVWRTQHLPKSNVRVWRYTEQHPDLLKDELIL